MNCDAGYEFTMTLNIIHEMKSTCEVIAELTFTSDIWLIMPTSYYKRLYASQFRHDWKLDVAHLIENNRLRRDGNKSEDIARSHESVPLLQITI